MGFRGSVTLPEKDASRALLPSLLLQFALDTLETREASEMAATIAGMLGTAPFRRSLDCIRVLDGVLAHRASKSPAWRAVRDRLMDNWVAYVLPESCIEPDVAVPLYIFLSLCDIHDHRGLMSTSMIEELAARSPAIHAILKGVESAP